MDNQKTKQTKSQPKYRLFCTRCTEPAIYSDKKTTNPVECQFCKGITTPTPENWIALSEGEEVRTPNQ